MPCPEDSCTGTLRRKDSRHGLFYGCDQWRKTGCVGAIGCHPDGSPLGVPAKQSTRKTRMAAHAAFDPIWKDGPMSRSEAYAWLAIKMGRVEVHMGEMSESECLEVISICAAYYAKT